MVSGTTVANTPPGPVSSLTATTTPSIIDVSWAAPTDDGGSPVTGYWVGLATVSPEAWIVYRETTTTNYRITKLNASTDYRVVVRAKNDSGHGVPSAISVSTKAATRPSVPTGLTATSTGRTSIQISWTAPVETGGSPTIDYVFQFRLNEMDSWLQVGTSGTTYTHAGLTPNTTHDYRVAAVGELGFSPFTSIIRFTTDPTTAPAAPTGLKATITRSRLALTWQAPSDNGGATITGYQIEASLTGNPGTWRVLIPASTGSPVPRFSTFAPLPGTTEYYRVRGYHMAGGLGAPSDALRVTRAPLTAPAAPTGLTASADGPTAINLSWTAPSNTGGTAITGYKIESFRPNGGLWRDVVSNTGTTATAYVHMGLTANAKYHYRVSAINSEGTGSASSAAGATTPPATVPAAPTGLMATADGQTTINLTWTAPTSTGGADITGYQIESSPTGANPWSDVESNTGSTARIHGRM